MMKKTACVIIALMMLFTVSSGLGESLQEQSEMVLYAYLVSSQLEILKTNYIRFAPIDAGEQLPWYESDDMSLAVAAMLAAYDLQENTDPAFSIQMNTENAPVIIGVPNEEEGIYMALLKPDGSYAWLWYNQAVQILYYANIANGDDLYKQASPGFTSPSGAEKAMSRLCGQYKKLDSDALYYALGYLDCLMNHGLKRISPLLSF